MPAPSHLLVIGDNADQLPLLAAEFAGAVDVAYLDPPYDHGDPRRGSQRRFAYEDRRGDDWVAWLGERLLAMRPLLSPHAPVAVSIGHRRLHDLAGLLAEVFPGYELVTITIDLRRSPVGRLGVQHTAEYLLVAVPPGVRLGAPGATRGAARNGWNGFALSGFDADDYPNQHYPIFVEKETGRIVEHGDGDDGVVAIWPVTRSGKKAVWRNARESFERLRVVGAVRAQRPHMPGNPQPFTIQYLTSGTRYRIESGEIASHGLDARGALILDPVVVPVGAGVPAVWSGPEFESRAGLARLDELLGPGHGFAYPKPPALVALAIQALSGGNRSATVLDVFAGSGTTLDAVATLNADDGGTRRVILIQQDEGDIVDRILLPRIRAVLGGNTSFEVRR